MISSLMVTIIVGIVAGWLAGKVTRGQGFGVWADLVLGIVGSFVGSFALSLIGLKAYGMIGEIVASTLGAVIVVWIVRMFSPRTIS